MTNKTVQTRVVVTGLGIVAPAAKDINEFLENLQLGQSTNTFLPELEQ
jgi:3-oxoacyl-(acyl-carrier-protein) synthase